MYIMFVQRANNHVICYLRCHCCLIFSLYIHTRFFLAVPSSRLLSYLKFRWMCLNKCVLRLLNSCCASVPRINEKWTRWKGIEVNAQNVHSCYTIQILLKCEIAHVCALKVLFFLLICRCIVCLRDIISTVRPFAPFYKFDCNRRMNRRPIK